MAGSTSSWPLVVVACRASWWRSDCRQRRRRISRSERRTLKGPPLLNLFLPELFVRGTHPSFKAPEEIAAQSIALVLLGNLVLGGRLIGGLPCLHLGLHPRDEIVVEVGVFLQVRGFHQRAVAGDDRVVIFQSRGRLRQRFAVLDHASAVAGVDQRDVLAG